jgi:large conductance mechanosensitive channel
VGAVSGNSDLATRSSNVGSRAHPVLLRWGSFVSAVITFVIVAAVIYFFVVLPVNKLMARFKTEPEPTQPTKSCEHCLSSIPQAASKCAFCTADLAA